MWRAPMSAIILLWRQDALRNDRIFPLQAIEEIDDGNEEANRRG